MRKKLTLTDRLAMFLTNRHNWSTSFEKASKALRTTPSALASALRALKRRNDNFDCVNPTKKSRQEIRRQNYLRNKKKRKQK